MLSTELLSKSSRAYGENRAGADHRKPGNSVTRDYKSNSPNKIEAQLNFHWHLCPVSQAADPSHPYASGFGPPSERCEFLTVLIKIKS